MIYSDELHRLRPLAWVAGTCLAFWSFTFYNFPRWSFVILAAITGVGLALVMGDALNRRVRRRRQDFELGETVRRERFQDELNEQIAGRRNAGRR